MEEEGKIAVLTNKHRNWLRGEESVAHEKKIRGRVHKRLRATIGVDSELLAEALEDGRLNADTVGNSLDFAELGDGISALVAALYRIADENGLDGERTIQKGIEQGKKGRITRLEQKLEREGVKALTLGELMDLRDAKPEHAERINKYGIDQDLSDLDIGFGTMDLEED